MSIDLTPYRRLAELTAGPGFGTAEYLTLRSRLMRDLPALLDELDDVRSRYERRLDQLLRWGSMTGAVEMIADERRRQVEQKGYAAGHDERHGPGELLNAGISYAIRAELANDPHRIPALPPPARWPWSPAEWKPRDDAVENMVRAAALIAAEIDRELEHRIGG